MLATSGVVERVMEPLWVEKFVKRNLEGVRKPGCVTFKVAEPVGQGGQTPVAGSCMRWMRHTDDRATPPRVEIWPGLQIRPERGPPV